MFFMKIDQIKKENIRYYNQEYILIDNFATILITEDDIYHAQQQIINAINNTFDVSCDRMVNVKNVFNKGDFILPHDDFMGEITFPEGNIPYSQMPIRGVLYLNSTKLYGTHLHKERPDWPKKQDEEGFQIDYDDPKWWTHIWDDGLEVGGEPGQLLLLKPQDNAWHSVGLHNDTIDNRITSNWIFFTSN